MSKKIMVEISDDLNAEITMELLVINKGLSPRKGATSKSQRIAEVLESFYLGRELKEIPENTKPYVRRK